MFLFPICSWATFLLYLALLKHLPHNFSPDPWLLIGTAVDLPLLVGIAFAVKSKNTPFAIFILFITIFIAASAADLSTTYRTHAPLSQAFFCLIISRIYHSIRGNKLSDGMPNSEWLYRKFQIEPIELKWRERFNKLIDKLSKYLNIISIIVIAIAFLTASPESLTFIIMGYSLVWLGFFALFVSPVLFIERTLSFTYALKNSSRLNETSLKVKEMAEQSKGKAKEAKSWLKDGFNEKAE